MLAAERKSTKTGVKVAKEPVQSDSSCGKKNDEEQVPR